MTQKEIVLEELTREARGLTAAELQERTTVPKHSLRTILSEMRKEGWIEVVGGLRGRYRYGATDEGRTQAPDTGRKTVRSDHTVQHDATRGLAAVDTYFGEHRRLNDFVRWLLLEKPDLFTGSTKEAQQVLERAVAEYAEKDMDVMRRYIEAALQRHDH